MKRQLKKLLLTLVGGVTCTLMSVAQDTNVEVTSEGNLLLHDNNKLQFGSSSNWTIQNYNNGLNFKLEGTGSGTGNYRMFINRYGKVGLGSIGSSTDRLWIEGSTRFSNWTDVTLDWSGDHGQACLFPERDWYLQLGHSGQKLGTIWVYNVRYNNLYENSDKRLKKEIDTVKTVLSKIERLNSYTYKFKDEYIKNAPEHVRQNNMNKKKFGFLAQEIDLVFPELVQKSDTGMMAVNYVGMIPILMQAIKEQQSQIDSQEALLQSQNEEITALKIKSQSTVALLEKIEQLEAKLELCCEANNDIKNKNELKSTEKENVKAEKTKDEIEAPKLYANAPNPFKDETTIEMVIPESAGNATINVYDLTGKQMKSYPVAGRGKTAVTIQGSELKPGMYLYALLIDGQLIDTKNMVVTE